MCIIAESMKSRFCQHPSQLPTLQVCTVASILASSLGWEGHNTLAVCLLCSCNLITSFVHLLFLQQWEFAIPAVAQSVSCSVPSCWWPQCPCSAHITWASTCRSVITPKWRSSSMEGWTSTGTSSPWTRVEATCIGDLRVWTRRPGSSTEVGAVPGRMDKGQHRHICCRGYSR